MHKVILDCRYSSFDFLQAAKLEERLSLGRRYRCPNEVERHACLAKSTAPKTYDQWPTSEGGRRSLFRADETDVGAAGLRRHDEHGLLARIPRADRRRRHALLPHPARSRAHARRAEQRLERPGAAALEGL